MTLGPEQSFLTELANWHGLRSVCLTFDTDFAPEYMLHNIIDILTRFGNCGFSYA